MEVRRGAARDTQPSDTDGQHSAVQGLWGSICTVYLVLLIMNERWSSTRICASATVENDFRLIINRLWGSTCSRVCNKWGNPPSNPKHCHRAAVWEEGACEPSGDTKDTKAVPDLSRAPPAPEPHSTTSALTTSGAPPQGWGRCSSFLLERCHKIAATQLSAGGSLREEKIPEWQFCKNTVCSSYVGGDWRLSVGGDWRLAVGDWRLVAVGGGWRRLVVGNW